MSGCGCNGSCGGGTNFNGYGGGGSGSPTYRKSTTFKTALSWLLGFGPALLGLILLLTGQGVGWLILGTIFIPFGMLLGVYLGEHIDGERWEQV